MQEPEPSAEQLRPSLSALPSVTDGRTQVAEISLGPLIEQEDERLGRFRGIFASYRTAEAGLPTLTSAFESSVMCPAARRVQSQQPHSSVILISGRQRLLQHAAAHADISTAAEAGMHGDTIREEEAVSNAAAALPATASEEVALGFPRTIGNIDRIKHVPSPHIILFLEISNSFGAGIPISIMDDNLPENCCFQGDFPRC